MKVILASASERRQELLARLVEKFTIKVSKFDEKIVKYKGNISEYVQDIAYGKALEVLRGTDEDAIIIAADTVVSINNKILGKPKDEQEAFSMLKELSGKTHIVCTGMVLINTTNNKVLKTSETTEVKFSSLSDSEIEEYIKTGEPLDKAGAYGIQGKGGIFVEEIHGCYYNVVGLPLNKLRYLLKEII